MMTLDGENELARHALPDGRTLVWRDESSPYENCLHIYLFSTDGHIADALEAGAAYADPILAFQKEGQDVFDFTFFKNERVYRLTVGREPKLRMLPLPWGFRYKSPLTRHLLSVSVLER
ncbi:MAG: hypothetical protein ACON3Z_19185 [Bradymonadia bacterium]